MQTEKFEKSIYQAFEDHNANSNNRLEPEEVMNLVDSIMLTIEKENSLLLIK